ncbi:hypothetical protein BY996DRAFT_6557066 [Phakopsora pachyrhizi]|nr:hypothetical protein BY996DRAFT_6557066 [Phakopsora pachyrhizi]
MGDWVKPDMSDDQGFTLTDAGSNPAALKEGEVVSQKEEEKGVTRYNNGTGDQLDVPLGTTAFVSGKKMLEILSLELKKSLAESRWRIWNYLGTSYLASIHPCGAEKLIIKPLSKSSTYNIDDDKTLLFKYGKMIEDLKTSTVAIEKRKICVCSTTEGLSTQSLERLRRTRTEPFGNATWPLAMNLFGPECRYIQATFLGEPAILYWNSKGSKP